MSVIGERAEPMETATDTTDPEQLFRQHRASLTGLARVLSGSPAAADELVQDAFVSLIRNRPRVTAGKELAYLRGVIVNRSKGRWRRKRTADRHLHVVATDPVDARQPADAAVAADLRLRVDDALQTLSHQQRACAALVYLVGLSVAEAADVLGIGSGSVKTHLHRARTALAPLLEDLR